MRAPTPPRRPTCATSTERCRRIADAELKAWCLRDNDAYFAKTVRQGKVILGVSHMPPWEESILPQELALGDPAFCGVAGRGEVRRWVAPPKKNRLFQERLAALSSQVSSVWYSAPA